MPQFDKVLRHDLGGAEVVYIHGVDAELVHDIADGDDRGVPVDLARLFHLQRVHHVDDARHAALFQLAQQRQLRLRIPIGVVDRGQISACERGALDAHDDRCVVGVVHRGAQDRDLLLLMPRGGGDVPQRLRRGEHARDRLRRKAVEILSV